MNTCRILFRNELEETKIVTLKEGERLKIGRSPSHEEDGHHALRIPANDVSSNHAEIRNNEYGWIVQDLGSKNGTKVRGMKLEAEQICLLENGETIQIAGHEIKVFTSIPTIKTPKEPLSPDNLRSMLQIDITTITAEIHGSGCAVEADRPISEQMITQRLDLFMFLSAELAKTYGHLDRLENNTIVLWWNNGIPFGAQEIVKSSGEFLACQTALALRDFAQTIAQRSDASKDFSISISISSGQAASGNFGNMLYDNPERLSFNIEDNFSDIITDRATYNLVEDSFRFEPVADAVVDGPNKSDVFFKLLRMRSRVKPHVTNAK